MDGNHAAFDIMPSHTHNYVINPAVLHRFNRHPPSPTMRSDCPRSQQKQRVPPHQGSPKTRLYNPASMTVVSHFAASQAPSTRVIPSSNGVGLLSMPRHWRTKRAAELVVDTALHVRVRQYSRRPHCLGSGTSVRTCLAAKSVDKKTAKCQCLCGLVVGAMLAV